MAFVLSQSKIFLWSPSGLCRSAANPYKWSDLYAPFAASFTSLDLYPLVTVTGPTASRSGCKTFWHSSSRLASICGVGVLSKLNRVLVSSARVKFFVIYPSRKATLLLRVKIPRLLLAWLSRTIPAAWLRRIQYQLGS